MELEAIRHIHQTHIGHRIQILRHPSQDSLVSDRQYWRISDARGWRIFGKGANRSDGVPLSCVPLHIAVVNLN